jgi:hypothetical protein
MIEGVRFVLWGTWRRARFVFWLCALVVVVGWFTTMSYGPSGGGVHGNEWDVLFGTLSERPIVLFWMPMFMFLTSRTFNTPWEAQAVARFRSRISWWASDIIGLAIATIVYVLATAVVALAAGSLYFGRWSWGWSALTRIGGTYAPVLHDTAPLPVAVDALALLTLGLWMLATLHHTISFWWSSEWVSLALLIVVIWLPLMFPAVHGVVSWTPGTQFVLGEHIAKSALAGFAWTIAYGVILACAGAWLGGIRALVVNWTT